MRQEEDVAKMNKYRRRKGIGLYKQLDEFVHVYSE